MVKEAISKLVTYARRTGLVFAKVLEHAGVYARNESGKAVFLRFLSTV